MTDYPSYTLEQAVKIAAKAHALQKDKAGAAYILHPLRVGLMGSNDLEKMAGFLHDVIEDTDWTADMLLGAAIPPEVVDLVVVLTRQDGEGYHDYIARVAEHPAAVRVKLNDLADNLRPDRVCHIPKDLAERYRRAQVFLRSCPP